CAPAEVAVSESEEDADAVDEALRPGPAALPRVMTRRLDLDHVGAHIGQVLARSGTKKELRERQNAHSGQKPEAFRLCQSTSCMMCVANATSSSRWFLTSILATVRSRSRSIPVISYSMVNVSPKYTGFRNRIRSYPTDTIGRSKSCSMRVDAADV